MLLRHLRGDATELPYAKVISAICEEFGCLPSEAEAELERDAARDEPLVFDVIEVRAFEAEARTFLEHAKSGRPLENPSALMAEVVRLYTLLEYERRGVTPPPEIASAE